MNSTAHVDEEVHGKVLEVDLHGKLGKEDYERFVPESEKMIRKYGKIRILITMHDFLGWDAGALWEDLKWNTKHFSQIERLAIIGEKSIEVCDASGAFDLQSSRSAHWHRWLTGFRRPFTNAQVRYFTLDQIDEARTWVNEL